MGLPPDQVWAMAPRDLVTVIDELNKQNRKRR